MSHIVTYKVSFLVTVNDDQTWESNIGGMRRLSGTGVFVPADALITTVFNPAYYYQTNKHTPGDGSVNLALTYQTSDPGPGWTRVENLT